MRAVLSRDVLWVVLLSSSGCPSSRQPNAQVVSKPSTPSTSEDAVESSESAGGLWIDLHANVRIPLGDVPTVSGENWLNITLEQEEGEVVIVGCTSGVQGSCRGTARTTLSRDERQTFATRMQGILAMPTCEPLASESGDYPFELLLGGATRKAHIPAGWFSTEPAHRDDPCRADVYMAYYLHTLWQARRPTIGG